MTPDGMDVVFQALGSAVRRRILDIVKEHPGCIVNEVSAQFGTSRIAVLKHIRVLEDARLLTSRKEGRVRRLYFNAVPIQMIYDRWTTEFSRFWASQLAEMKYRVETIQEPPSGGEGEHDGSKGESTA
jgi:predicted transcriptional regulator